jgi:DNA modification methylase
MSYQLIQASASAIPLADESVQTCVTSPPYWGLREYAGESGVRWRDGTVHPLGLEPTPELFVEHMVEVFREVKRVLRPDGTLWLNLGDSYASTLVGYGNSGGSYEAERDWGDVTRPRRDIPTGLKPKDLVGIPWRVAFALQADGWYLRSDIIWAKPNPMPESVTDRPTKAHEYIFLLSKSPRYYFDADAVREASKRPGEYPGGDYAGRDIDDENVNRGWLNKTGVPVARNIRTVWDIATQPYSGAHFATFPEAIPERCIKAGSASTACGECGAPWERVTERGETRNRTTQNGDGNGELGSYGRFGDAQSSTTGWQPTCEHDDGTGTSLVLDPFNGSGTTGRVAQRLSRDYVGLDTSREYLEMAVERVDPIQAAHRDARAGTSDQQVMSL